MLNYKNHQGFILYRNNCEQLLNLQDFIWKNTTKRTRSLQAVFILMNYFLLFYHSYELGLNLA